MLSATAERKPTEPEFKDIDLEAQVIPLFKPKYLDELDENEIKAIEKKYPKSPSNPYEFKSLQELDEDIGRHLKRYYLKRGRYELARCSNFLYVIFQADTAQEGVPTFVHVFVPNAEIPLFISIAIGYPCAILDCLTYYWNFSARKVAAEKLLDELHQPPLKNRMHNAYRYFCSEPKQASQNLLTTLFHEGILFVCNISAIMTEIIDISDKLDTLPLPLKWISIAGILSYGKDFMEIYLKTEYYKELKNYWYNDKIPWVVRDLIKRKKFAILLQILIESIISTAAFRAFPYYYSVALNSYTALGWYPPAAFVSALIAYENIVYIYPKTVKKYVGDMYAVENLLQEKIQRISLSEIMAISSENMDAKTFELKSQEILLRNMDNEKKKIFDEIHKQKGCIKLTSKASNLHITSRSFIGGFFGYSCLASLLLLAIDAPIAIPVVSVIAGSALFMEVLRRTMQEKLDYEEARRYLESPEVSSDKQPVLVKAGGALLIAGNGASTAMSNMGLLARIPGSDSPWLRALCAMIAIDNMIVTMEYNAKSTLSTVSSMAKSSLDLFNSVYSYSSDKISRIKGTLFSRNNIQAPVAQEQQSSWLCSRRRNG